jgi:hypothetical protein
MLTGPVVTEPSLVTSTVPWPKGVLGELLQLTPAQDPPGTVGIGPISSQVSVPV